MSARAPAPAAAGPAPSPAPAVAASTKTTKKKTKKSAASGTTKTKKKPRRKKPSTAGTSRPAPSASSALAIYQAAQAAQKELAQQSAQALARRTDPLWYRFEEPLQSITADNRMEAAGAAVLPDQVELVDKALANSHMDRTDVTPQAFACLLEQARRHALELMADAQDYAFSANRPDVTRADLLLAAEMRSDLPMATFSQQPKIFKMARQVNCKPLPPIPTHCYNGVVLPPKQHQLTARTFDVISGAQVAQRMVAPPPEAPVNKTVAPKPSYGASRGRQIPIQLSKQITDKTSTGAKTTGATSSSAATSAAAAAKPPVDAGTKRKADQL